MITRPDKTYRHLQLGLLLVLGSLLLLWAACLPAANAYELEIMEAASGMVSNGDWGLPRNAAGEIIYHTPILPFWLAAAGHFLLPDGPLGYRLCNLVLGLFGFWGYYKLINRYLDARTAFYSGCVLASALFFSWQLQLATPDSIYALSICTALFAFYPYLKTGHSRYFWYIYGSIAIGILSKGLIALLIPLLIMAVHLMFRIKMNEATLKRIRFARGMGLVFLLVLPWYVYISLVSGGSWFYVFWNEFHLERYFGDGQPAGNAFYLPFAYAIFGLLPAGVFLFRALPFGWKYRVRKDLMLLCLLSVLIILFFFAFSASFYPHYILVALPFGAVLIGYRLSQAAGRPLPRMDVNLGVILLAVQALAIPACLYYYFPLPAEADFPPGLYMLLLVLPLAATLGCLLLWYKKRTDEGIIVLSTIYLVFNGLLMYYAAEQEDLGGILSQLLF